MPLAINENLISKSSHCQWQWSLCGWLAGLAVEETLSSSELHSNLLLINTSLCFTSMMYSKAHTALTDNTLDVQWPDILQMDSISTVHSIFKFLSVCILNMRPKEATRCFVLFYQFFLGHPIPPYQNLVHHTKPSKPWAQQTLPFSHAEPEPSERITNQMFLPLDLHIVLCRLSHSGCTVSTAWF